MPGPIVELLRSPVGSGIHALAHITGGGLAENLERVLPENTHARIPRGWPEPPVFAWLRSLADIEESEIDQVFNRGVGMVLVVDPRQEQAIWESLLQANLSPFSLGEIVAGERGVTLV